MTLEFDCPECGHKIVTRYLRVGEIAKCRSCGASRPVPQSAEGAGLQLSSKTASDATGLPQNGVLKDRVETVAEIWQLFHSSEASKCQERLLQIAECNPNLLLDFLAQDWQAIKARDFERRLGLGYKNPIVLLPHDSGLMMDNLLRAVQTSVLNVLPRTNNPKLVQTMAHLIKSTEVIPAVSKEVRMVAVNTLLNLREYTVLATLQQNSDFDEVMVHIRRALIEKDGFPQESVDAMVDALCSTANMLPERSSKWLELCVHESAYFNDLLFRTRERKMKLINGLSRANEDVARQLSTILAKKSASETQLMLKVSLSAGVAGLTGVLLIWYLVVQRMHLNLMRTSFGLGILLLLSVVLFTIGLGVSIDCTMRLRRLKKYRKHDSW